MRACQWSEHCMSSRMHPVPLLSGQVRATGRRHQHLWQAKAQGRHPVQCTACWREDGRKGTGGLLLTLLPNCNHLSSSPAHEPLTHDMHIGAAALHPPSLHTAAASITCLHDTVDVNVQHVV